MSYRENILSLRSTLDIDHIPNNDVRVSDNYSPHPAMFWYNPDVRLPSSIGQRNGEGS